MNENNDLFQSINFKSHSGLDLNWKIECEGLSYLEWFTISKMIMEVTLPFRKAVGIPEGGIKLANLLNEHATENMNDPICIVDDVLTTGNSMEDFLEKYRQKNPYDYIGWVVFARGKCPNWVTALFQMPSV